MTASHNITFTTLTATEAERRALEENRRAVEEQFFEEIDRLEDELFRHLDTPAARNAYMALDQARWRRGVALTETTYAMGRRCATMIDRFSARAERDLEAAGSGQGSGGGAF